MAGGFLPVELAFLIPRTSAGNDVQEAIEKDDVSTASLSNNFLGILSSATAQRLIKEGRGAHESLCAALQQRAVEYIGSAKDDASMQHVFSTGVAALELFVQANWTGPQLSEETLAQVLPVAENDKDGKDVSRKSALQELSVNGEPAYVLTTAPELLCIARALLGVSVLNAQESSDEDGSESDPPALESADGAEPGVATANTFATPLSTQLDGTLASAALWRARTLFVHQALLANPAAALHDAIMQEMESVVVQLDGPFKVADIPARMLLEHGRYHTYYNEVYKALKCWQEAQKWLGLEIELSGAMGVRTKFQTKATSQLLLSVRHGHTPVEDAAPAFLPEKKHMNDDTRLEKIDFGRSDRFSEKLSLVEQATVLAMCTNVNNQNPKHGITTEEMKPYLDYVISSPCDWLVQTVALWTLARLEATDMRAMTRSVEQMQTLSNHFQDAEPPAAYRIQSLWVTAPPPRWLCDRELANLCFRLGLTRDALVVYEKWEMWDKMIECYQHLEMVGKAEALVRERLEVEPTPTLYNVLGDILRKEEYYEKAWELSKHRDARSQRSIGHMHLMEAERAVQMNQAKEEDLADKYRKAMCAFQKAVNLNRLLGGTWFSLGCAAQRIKEWEVVVHAFRQKVDIDQEDYESWSNLAQGYIKLGRKRKAYFALREACKNEYSNWKLWENLLWVSVDVGAFADVIRAIGRLLDIRKDFQDGEVLTILATVVTDDGVEDLEGYSCKRFLKQARELFERCQSTGNLNAASWTAISVFHSRLGEVDEANACLRKAFQAAKGVPEWEKSADTITPVVDALERLVAGYANGSKKELNTAKLLANTATSAINRAKEEGFHTDETDAELDRLAGLLETITVGLSTAE
eukprot:m.510963 g.510963  ORF g.510963 m.510963 type:complete len:867 (-) comp21890_c0_seq1:289-2889(-)